MKNIEEIIEMMKSINPDIKMDWNFKRALKNKLEITAFSKIKNTKNKKINKAKSWFFSFKKDNKNIFEKPKLNFIKLLSPIFVWAFAVFWFINFYGQDLFINNNWENYNNNFKYEVDRIEEESLNNSLSTEGFSPLKVEKKINENSPIMPFHKGDEQVSSDTLIIENKNIKKVEKKKIIQRKKEPVIKTKKIIKKEIINKDKKVKEKDKIRKIILENKTEWVLKSTDINSKKNINIKKENNINTEIIDLLWDWESGEQMEATNNNSPIIPFHKEDEETMQDFPENIIFDEAIPEIDLFVKYCEEKKWIIKNNICEYWNNKCSRKDFENKKCDEK